MASKRTQKRIMTDFPEGALEANQEGVLIKEMIKEPQYRVN